MAIVEHPDMAVKCRTAIKTFFHYLKLCRSVQWIVLHHLHLQHISFLLRIV